MTEALTWLSSNPGKWALTAATMMLILIAACLIQNFIDKRRSRK